MTAAGACRGGGRNRGGGGRQDAEVAELRRRRRHRVVAGDGHAKVKRRRERQRQRAALGPVQAVGAVVAGKHIADPLESHPDIGVADVRPNRGEVRGHIRGGSVEPAEAARGGSAVEDHGAAGVERRAHHQAGLGGAEGVDQRLHLHDGVEVAGQLLIDETESVGGGRADVNAVGADVIAGTVDVDDGAAGGGRSDVGAGIGAADGAHRWRLREGADARGVLGGNLIRVADIGRDASVDQSGAAGVCAGDGGPGGRTGRLPLDDVTARAADGGPVQRHLRRRTAGGGRHAGGRNGGAAGGGGGHRAGVRREGSVEIIANAIVVAGSNRRRRVLISQAGARADFRPRLCIRDPGAQCDSA